MEIRIKKIMEEKGMRMADFCRATETDPATIKTMLSRGSCKIATLAKYAAALRVPIWEMIYDCGISSVGRELPEWNTPNYENRISELMRTRNQVDVASKMGINQASLSMLLQRGNPGLPNIEKFAIAFGIEPWELFISREDMEKELARRKEPITLTSEPKPSSFSSVDDKTFNSMRHYFEMERRDKEAAQTPSRSMNDSEKEPDLFDTIADDAEETEMISVAESKRRMRKALQLLMDNLGRIRPETLDRIVEQACK